MGSAESILSNAQQQPTADDEITTVSERKDGIDPILERLKSLKIATPILKSRPPQTTDSSLTDILVRKPLSSSSVSGTLNPNVLLELFSLYCDWQEEKAKRISQKQDEIEIKIETTDALAVKLLQRLNYSLSAMRTTAHHLSDGSVSTSDIFSKKLVVSRKQFKLLDTYGTAQHMECEMFSIFLPIGRALLK